jgi:cellulose synthase/poly-beta-1,6-N-acetylglucosamine synthase-like glycosyltransferase
VAVLVPAHDEEAGIAATIASILRQLRPGDRILVVADNCTDHTAEVAREAGAETIERQDPARRGKGFALDFGLRHLADDPPFVVVFVDADCTLLDRTLDTLAKTVWTEDRPVQGCYLSMARDHQKHAFGMAEFAFLIKNHVRPRGLAHFGLPCQLTGSGMALPWSLASSLRLSTAEIVEDMKLGLDLSEAGYFPVYCETAGVRSYFPGTAAGAATQRRRWERGHLSILASGLRRLVGVRAWSLPYVAMVLDIMVPPLSLLALLIAGLTFVSGLIALAGFGLLPLVISLCLGVLFVGATALAWVTHGRDAIPLGTLLRLPEYALRKSALYAQLLFDRSERVWVRTSRSPAEEQGERR